MQTTEYDLNAMFVPKTTDIQKNKWTTKNTYDNTYFQEIKVLISQDGTIGRLDLWFKNNQSFSSGNTQVAQPCINLPPRRNIWVITQNQYIRLNLDTNGTLYVANLNSSAVTFAGGSHTIMYPIG